MSDAKPQYSHLVRLGTLGSNAYPAELDKMRDNICEYVSKNGGYVSGDDDMRLRNMWKEWKGDKEYPFGVYGGIEIDGWNVKFSTVELVAMGLVVAWYINYSKRDMYRPKKKAFQLEFLDDLYCFNKDCITDTTYEPSRINRNHGVATVRGDLNERKEHKSLMQHIGIQAQNISSLRFSELTRKICNAKSKQREHSDDSAIKRFIHEFNINVNDFDKECIRPGKSPHSHWCNGFDKECIHPGKSPHSHWCNEDDYFSRKLSQSNQKFLKDMLEKLNDKYVLFSPASCRTLLGEFPKLRDTYIKGKNTTVAAILNMNSMNTIYMPVDSNYWILISRLAIEDYHRVHSPVSGTIKSVKEIKSIPGSYSVHPTIVQQSRIDVYATNHRVVVEIEMQGRDRFVLGLTVYLVIVGATCVDSIKLNDNIKNDESVNAGDEIASFHYGGSTVLTLFTPPNNIELDTHIHRSVLMNGRFEYETYLEVGVPIIAREYVKVKSCDDYLP